MENVTLIKEVISKAAITADDELGRLFYEGEDFYLEYNEYYEKNQVDFHFSIGEEYVELTEVELDPIWEAVNEVKQSYNSESFTPSQYDMNKIIFNL